MLVIGFVEGRSSRKNSLSESKTLAANAAAVSSKKETQSGKAGKMADTSCHHLSQRDLWYFTSKYFEEALQRMKDKQMAKEYGHLIASRKREANTLRANTMALEVLDLILADTKKMGYTWSWGQVKALFAGYKSQAVREIKLSEGFNRAFYKSLAKALEDKDNIRWFLRRVNTLKVWNKPRF